MQTFLPYADFKSSAQCLDRQRLGKQRVECKQILNALAGLSKGWTKHPATLMWAGYEDALKAYANECILEWIDRGYKNTMPLYEVPDSYEYPPWFGDDRFHSSHRANLMRKRPNYYKRYEWDDDPTDEYVWPTQGENK